MANQRKDNLLQHLDDEARKALAVCAEYILDIDADTSLEKGPEYYIRNAYSENTYRSYRADLKDFVSWAGIGAPVPVTASTVIEYLAERAKTLAPTTLAHRAAAISFIHRLLGHSDPTQSGAVSALLKGIRKDAIDNGWEEDQAPAFSVKQLLAMVDAINDVSDENRTPQDLRDKTLILVGAFGAFRQSELSNLTVSRLKWVKLGATFRMGRVKQDQTASEVGYRPIPYLTKQPQYCPATALQAYMGENGIEDGPIFRGIHRNGKIRSAKISKDTVNRAIKKWAKLAGLPNPDEYSVHSLRATFVTVLRGMNITDAQISRQTAHKNLATMQIYDRPETAFAGSPVLLLADKIEASAKESS